MGMSLYFLAVLCLEQMTNKEINQLIVKVGKKIGNVVFSQGSQSCFLTGITFKYSMFT